MRFKIMVPCGGGCVLYGLRSHGKHGVGMKVTEIMYLLPHGVTVISETGYSIPQHLPQGGLLRLVLLTSQ
jgi:hypothetical protein